MPTRLRSRFVAPLLVLGGAALFGLGAGGIPRVDAQLGAATTPLSQRQPVSFVDDSHPTCRPDRRTQDQRF